MLPEEVGQERIYSYLENYKREDKIIGGGEIEKYIGKDIGSWVEEKKKARISNRIINYFIYNRDLEEILGSLEINKKLKKEEKEDRGHIQLSIEESKRGRSYGNYGLALGIKKCRDLGIKKLNLVCNESNTRGKRIIENNQGVLEKQLIVRDTLVNRYLIW